MIPINRYNKSIVGRFRNKKINIANSILAKTNKYYFILFLLLYGLLNLISGIAFLLPLTLKSIFIYIIFLFINLGLTQELLHLILFFTLPQYQIQHLDKIEKPPKVALLYTTCDDAMEFALDNLSNQTYQNLDIYILDDSKYPENKIIIDRYSYKTIRRETRNGFKAGNINHWLKNYGTQYKYISILDSDSILSNNFIEEMVKVAEHPANEAIAIFQSKRMIWNKNNAFVKSLTIMEEAGYSILEKVANHCYPIFSLGHNELVRVEALLKIGGYNEKYVSEDFATSLDLMKLNYKILLVDIISYEAMPSNIIDYSNRMKRWAKSTLDIFLHYNKNNLSPTIKLSLFLLTMNYLIWFLYFPGLLLLLWTYSANNCIPIFQGVYNFNNIVIILSKSFCVILLLFGRWPLFYKFKIKLREYFKLLILHNCLGYYLAVPLILSQLELIFNHKVNFNVSSKISRITNFTDILTTSKITLIFITFILVLLFLSKSSTLAFGIVLLIPVLIFPFVLYYFTTQ